MGESFMIGNHTATPHPRRGRGRGRPPRGGGRRAPPYPLGKFCGFYLLVLAISILMKMMFIEAPLDPGAKVIGFVITHLGGGLAMNRYVLHRVVWHHDYNTVADIAKLKTSLLLFWQVMYPFFFLQLALVRYC